MTLGKTSGIEMMTTNRNGLASVLRMWPFAAGLFLILLSVAASVRHIFRGPAWPSDDADLSLFLQAARAISRGQNPYDWAIYTHKMIYGYPPLFAELLAILRLPLGDGRLWMIWAAFGVICLAAAMALMMRRFGRTVSYRWIVLAVGALMIGHITRSDIYNVQPNFILLLLIVVGIYQFSKNRLVSGSLAWAAVIVCKPFTGAMVFYLMRRGQWREALATLLASSLLFVGSFVPLLPISLEVFKSWLQASHWHSAFPNVAKPTNETFYGLFYRLFADNEFTTPWMVHPGVIQWLMIPVLLLAIGGIYFGVSSPGRRAATPLAEVGAHDLLEVGLTLGLVMSCGPLMEGPHMFMLLPGLFGAAMLAQTRWRANAPTKWWWLAAAASWSLIFAFFTIPISTPVVAPFSWGRLSGLEILVTAKFGFLTAFACISSALALWQERARPSRPRLGLANPWGREPVGMA